MITSHHPKPRRMIAIGSGGNKFIELLAAAHELRNMNPTRDWDVLAGISAGALVAALISLIPLNNLETFNRNFERAKCKFTKDAESSPFRPHIPLGEFANALFAVIFNKESVFAGMSDFVDNEFNTQKYETSGRQLLVGVFDNTHQQYRTVDSKCSGADTMRNAILASASVPVALPAVNVAGVGRCRDGGMCHTIPVKEIIRFVNENKRAGYRVHVDLLISDQIQRPPEQRQNPVNITGSLLDACTSLVWLNLQRDLVMLSDVLGDTRAESDHALHLIRSGKQHNFERHWGTLRVVAPIDLGSRRQVRTRFAIPKQDVAEALIQKGARAARASM